MKQHNTSNWEATSPSAPTTNIRAPRRRPVYSIAGRLLLLLLATIVLWGHAGGQNARWVRVCKCYWTFWWRRRPPYVTETVVVAMDGWLVVRRSKWDRQSCSLNAIGIRFGNWDFCFFFSVLWNFNVRDLNRSNRLFFKGRLLGLDHFCIKPVFDFIHRLFYTSKAHTPCFYLLNCHAMPTGRPFPCPLKYVLECKSTYTDFTTNPLVYSTHQNGYYLQVPDFAFPFFVFRAQKVNINQALFYLSLSGTPEKGSLVYTHKRCPFTWAWAHFTSLLVLLFILWLN